MKSWSIIRRYFRSGTRKDTRHTHKQRFPVRNTSYLGSINGQQARPGHSKTDRHASGSACHAEHLRPQKNWGSCPLEPVRGQALMTRRTHIGSWSSQRAQASQDQRVEAASPSARWGGHSAQQSTRAVSIQCKSSAAGLPSHAEFGFVSCTLRLPFGAHVCPFSACSHLLRHAGRWRRGRGGGSDIC